MVTKILDFIQKDLNYKVLKSFFDYPDRFFRNLAENDEKLQFFWSVIYQPHEVAGEQLLCGFRIAPSEVASLRLNRGSNRKLRKRQNSISKQM